MLQQQALMLQGLIPGQSSIGASAIPGKYTCSYLDFLELLLEQVLSAS